MRISVATGLLAAVGFVSVAAIGGGTAGSVAAGAMRPAADCHSLAIGANGKVNTTLGARRLGVWLAHQHQHHVSAAQISREEAARFCVVQTSAPSKYRLVDSTNADMNVAVTAAWDSQAKTYYSIGTWNWVTGAWKQDVGGLTYGGVYNIGKPDIMGIAYNYKVFDAGESLTYWGNGNYYGTVTKTKDTDDNPYGVVFEVQDQASSDVGETRVDLNTLHGEMVTDYHSLSGCDKNFQAFFKYGHDWSSTAINGFSIGEDSIGVSWSSQSHEWAETAHSTSSLSVCTN